MTPIFDEIRASDIELWATRAESERWMPSLLQQLVLAAGAELRQCRFLTHEKTNLGGWDGIVEAATAGLNVPAGFSGWELSRTGDPGVLGKACDDAEKRAGSPGALITINSTLIVVTLRVWPRRRKEDGSFEEAHEHKTKWAREQAERLGWQKVVVLDALDLSAWIAGLPGVGLWLSEIMGRKVAGAFSLLHRWETLRTLRAGMSPDVFLAGRNTFCEMIDAWLSAPGGEAFEVRSWSYEEVGDVLAAWLAKREKDNFPSFSAVSVTSPEAWRTLSLSPAPLLLLADGGIELTPEQISAASAQGHRVILRTHAGRSRGAGATLPPLGRDPLADILQKCAVDHQVAWRWAGECGGSGVVLKRILGGRASVPEWANGSVSAAWAPVVLFGAWDADCKADRERIAEVFGQPYAEVEDLLRPWISSNHPLLKQTGSQWRVLSREDAWRFLSPRLKGEYHIRFRSAATCVLQELNPRYEMPAKERIYAGIYKKEPRHSHRLRRGMAETLCLLAVQAPEGHGESRAGDTADAVVAQVLEQGDNWQLWASLGQALPLLAEASPDEFLKALEKDLRAAAPACRELLSQGDEHIFSDTPHVELVWALEGLMWDRRWVVRACVALAHLAALDPGGKCSPRPAGALREAFLPWYPQCCLNVTDRCQVIDQVVRAEPAAGWTLLIGLLPKKHDMSSPRHRPQFRDSARVVTCDVSPQEYWEQVSHVARRLVKNVGGDADRWTELIGELDAVPDDVFETAIRHLEEAMRDQEPAERDHVWEALRAEVARHRYFAKADWAMPEDRMEKMEKLVRRFEPADFVPRSIWLFRPGAGAYVPGTSSDTPYEETERHGENVRRAMLADIHAQGGLAAVARLVEQVDDFQAARIGRLCATADFQRDDVILPVWLESESAQQRAFARGYAGVRFGQNGWPWLHGLGWTHWPAKLAGDLASIFPLLEETWRQIEAAGTEFSEAYWRNTGAWMHGASEGEAARVIRELVARGRPYAALDGISSCRHSKTHLPAGLILEALESIRDRDTLQTSDAGPQEKPRQLDVWHLHAAIECLQEADDLTDAELGRAETLEWFFLPVFEHHGKPRRLIQRIHGEPEEFVEAVLMSGYKSDDPTAETTSLTEEERTRAKVCRKLLEHLKELPATNEKGRVEEAAFLTWMKKARTLAAEKKHLKACDRIIGRLLLHSPVEADGMWPCTPVCRLLTESGSEEMARGFEIAIFNNQGWPGPLRDGMDMSSVASRHDAVRTLRELAEKLDLSFPIIAALLRSVASSEEDLLRRHFRNDE